MKTCLLLTAASLLLVGCTDPNNGRYQTTQGEGRFFVTDTQTGEVYMGSLPYGGTVHKRDSLMRYSFPIRQR